jgi:hypothetical protein
LLVHAQGVDQAVELFGQALDCLPSALEIVALGVSADASAQPFIGILDDLQRLAKVMRRHAEQGSLEIAGAPKIDYSGAGSARQLLRNIHRKALLDIGMSIDASS